jgi:hypothetical protein
MYTAILFWFSGILLTIGLNYKVVCPDGSSFSHKIDIMLTLSFYYLLAWPFFLGDSIRGLIKTNNKGDNAL